MPSSRKRDESIERLLRQSVEARDRPGGTESCLDAETVAAMMDGGLPASALNAAYLHAADCARCQSLISMLVRTDSAGLAGAAGSPETESEHTHGTGWWLARLVPISAAAAAAAIALWVTVYPRPAAPLPQETEARRQTAEPNTEQPATRAQQPVAPSDRFEAKAKANSTPQPQRTLTTGDVASSEKDVTSQLRGDNANGPADDRLNKELPAKPAAAAPAVRAAPSQPSANVLDSARAAGQRAESVNVDVISPVPMVRWRLAGSVVQRSTDGGVNWETQSTGTEAELTAGAAPSATVCWIVGRAGVVLLSIDGRSWRRLPFPEITDLSAVRARDARAASVSTADGRTFSTIDAGATWAPRPLQDF